jgi:phage shock protein PspC (stress-responsive transcriptional regulator)
VFRLDVYNDDSWGGRVIVYASVFHVALVAAIVYLVAGLFTPSSTVNTSSAGSPTVNR